MKISILLPTFKRAELLKLGLYSILLHKIKYDYEILVLNDGIHDDTEAVCKQFSNDLNIKYIFTGQRNTNGLLQSRVPGFAMNIGFKRATGDIFILSCPEIYHLNNAIDLITDGVICKPKCMVVPSLLYFDLHNAMTAKMIHEFSRYNSPSTVDLNLLVGGHKNDGWNGHAIMPYCMGIERSAVFAVKGYAEDMTGYAGDDNDFCKRLQMIGLKYYIVDAKVIHLYHQGTGDGCPHWDNEKWVHNYNLFINRKKSVVNQADNWGNLDE